MAVSTLGSNSANVWRLPEGREVGRYNPEVENPPSSPILLPGVALSPEGDYLATSLGGGTDLRVWELPEGHEVARVDSPTAGEDTITLSPNGEYLAAAGGHGVLLGRVAIVWETQTGKEVARMDHEEEVEAVAFSPNGEYLATASRDSTARVWKLPDGREVARVEHEDWVDAVAFSPDGNYLATASDDGTARVWELPEGSEVARISFGGSSISKEDALDAISFVSGGEYLATARVDGTAQIWQWRPQDLIDEACSYLSRNLTRKEWSLYLGDEPYRETCRNLPTDYVVEEYVTSEFKPAFRFELGKDWIVVAPETTNELIMGIYEGGQLIFTNPRHIFDPSDPSKLKELPAPENATEWISWFQNHPNLGTSKLVPVSVGGASGMKIDVTASSTPKKYPQEICGRQPCVPLFPTSGPGDISSSEGWKDRFIIVDVGGETVLIDVAAPEDKFDTFSPKAQKVLDSVEWKGG